MPRLTADLFTAPGLAKPSGFTHAVRTGDVIRLSGQTALNTDGAIVPGGIVE
jgi:enamine deaminase RidA (YjgF/YER057c/UK114 family)